MKVIGLTHNSDNTCENSTLGVFLMSDTSILKDGKPFFVPNFSTEISIRPSYVLRINRLGKNISKKFAHRYYNGITFSLNLTA